jgi:hypothetical protein
MTGEQVRLLLAGIGISLTLPDQEVAYARITGVTARATQNRVRQTLEWSVKSFQVRAQIPCASLCVHPILYKILHLYWFGSWFSILLRLIGTNKLSGPGTD